MTTSLEKASRTRAFVRSSALVAAFTFLSRITGFVREILVASAFGTTQAASALVIAQTVPNVTRSLASEEMAQGTLVPSLSKLAEEHLEAERRRVALLSAAWATLALAVIAVVVLSLARITVDVISPGARDAQRDTTTTLLQLLVPVIVFNGLLGAASASLVSERRFGVVGAGAVFSNLPVLIGLALNPDASVELVAVLLMAGYAVQAAYLGLFAFATRRGAPRTRLSPEQKARVRKELKRIGLLAPPIMLSIGMANLSGIVDVAFSSLVSTGAPAALDKAFRLIALPYGVFAIAIGVVALPSLSRVRGHEFDDELERTLRFVVVILFPIAIATALLADDAVRIAYERGEFDAASSALTADALVGLSFALPALGLSLVGTRAWISQQRPWTPAIVAVIGVIFNAVLNAILIGPFGVTGIGLSTAVVHGLVGVGLIITAACSASDIGLRLARFLARYGALLIASTAAAYAASSVLEPVTDSVIAHATGGLVGLVTLVLMATRLGVDDYRVLFASLRRGRTGQGSG